MAKYDPLYKHLRHSLEATVCLRFDDIADMVDGLPPSAYDPKRRMWWSNSANGRRSQAAAWRRAGYVVDVIDFEQRNVRFKRNGRVKGYGRFKRHGRFISMAGLRNWWHQATKDTKVAAVSAIIALIAAAGTIFFAARQYQIGVEQNNNAEQQELVSLVTDIAQEPQSMAQASEIINDNPTLLHNVSVQLQLTELAEGEEAYSIIEKLPPSEVSTGEYYQVGLAIQAGYNDEAALTLFKKAASQKSDPRSRGDALRQEAQILYLLKMNAMAKSVMTDAEYALNGQGAANSQTENWIADTEFFAVQFQASISCPAAIDDYSNAISIMAKYPSAVTPTLAMAKSTANAELRRQCPAQAPAAPSCATLRPIITILIADQAAQDKALQDDWGMGGQPTTELQKAITATSNATVGPAAQFNQDAQTYLSDNTPAPSSSATSDADALRHDIIQLAAVCGVPSRLAATPPADGV